MAFVGCRSSQRNAFPWENSGGCTLAPFGGRAGSHRPSDQSMRLPRLLVFAVAKKSTGKPLNLKTSMLLAAAQLQQHGGPPENRPKTTQDHPRPPQRRNPGLAEPGPSRQAPRHHKPFFRWPSPLGTRPTTFRGWQEFIASCTEYSCTQYRIEYKGPAIGVCSNRSVCLSVCLIDGWQNP